MLSSLADRKIYRMHAELCKTLANPSRLEILNLLRDKERSVNELTVLTGRAQATVSQHLAVLRQRGVVSTRKVGFNVYYKIAHQKMIQACDLIREVLFEQIAEMEKLTKKE
jgi:DNA-binding transcriptional ArsR family regulator